MASPHTPVRPPNDEGLTMTELLVVMVILLGVMGIVAQIFTRSYDTYERQRQYVDARYSTAAATDMIVRLLRSATTIDPDPDGNNLLDSVRVEGDWNPKDGDTADSYENVTFSVAAGTLFKQEPADGGPVPFADRIASITFAYRNPAGAALATPWTASQTQLGYVDLTVLNTQVDGWPGSVTAASASVRRTE